VASGFAPRTNNGTVAEGYVSTGQLKELWRDAARWRD
jgi:hypothetical protein